MSPEDGVGPPGSARHNPDRIAFLYLGASIVLGVIGQMALKIVSAELSGIHLEFRSPLALPEAILGNPRVLVGLIVYGSGDILWLLALSRADLSALYPYTAISFVLVLLASALWFQEEITPARLAGVLIVAVGIVIFARDERRAAARERMRIARRGRGRP